MPVETRGQERRKNEKRKWEDGVRWIEDFPFEVIEKIASYLKPTDVPKLMMVNKRLHSGYAREESVVFGNHVDEIMLDVDCLIKKHPDSREFELDIDHHLHLIKRVTSCDKLCIWTRVGPSDINETHKTILKQLKSVNCLNLYMTSIADLTKLLTHFHASVNENAKVYIKTNSFKDDQLVSDLLGNFIETQLTDCEEIGLDCSLFRVCYQALKKTLVKRIEMNEGNIYLALQWIVKHGIPSKMPEAGFYTLTRVSHEKGNELISFLTFLTKDPGMKQIVGENRVSLLEKAKKLWKYEPFDKEVVCFRQKIDLTKDCIYLVHFYHRYFILEYIKFYAFCILSTSTE